MGRVPTASASELLLNSPFVRFIPFIVFYGFISIMGVRFAQKIGAKLLFLDGHYNFIQDILKPALFVGVLGAGAVLIINAVIPLAGAYPYILFYKPLFSLVSVINYDVFLFLFCLCGFALLIKKITKNSSMTIIEYASVVLVALLQNGIWWIWQFGTAAFPIDPFVYFGLDVLLGTLFWKKGFETTVLCHLIIATILYVIAPAASIVLS